MPTPPTGAVTFLFTDIEGSTTRWEHHRAAMRSALDRHNALVSAAIDAHGGFVFKTVGDAFCAAFANPTDAVQAAIDAQRALAAENWARFGEDFPYLRVRMAIHTGAAEHRDGDYLGPPLNRVARLLATAHGGQVLVSLATQQLVRDQLPEGATLVDLGVHRLKDLKRTEHLFRVVAAGFPDIAMSPDTAEQVQAGAHMHIEADALPAECPYRGLLAFRENDAPFFFGREAFTDRLVRDIAGRPMVGVIGPSGSGKSSVVFAGLMPRLAPAAASGEIMNGDRPHGAGWTVLALRPGAEPFESLAAVLLPRLEPELSETDRLVEIAKLAAALRDGALSVPKVVRRIHEKTGEAGRLLLVADQFEELFTLCPDERDQRRFQDLLFETLADAGNGGGASSADDQPVVKLVLTLRADFMGHAMAYRPFSDALQDNNILLGPMNREELTTAILKPAELQGRAFESGLVDRILADVGDEAGQLPLLEFALTKLWERQQGGWLTHEAYEEIGRVEGAVARHADAVLDRLPVVDQDGCRRVFVQMVRPGEGTEDTRRLATKEELGEDWTLVRRLADARLVVTSRDTATARETVEVVHEALIRSWGQLKGWMNADRAFRTWQERARFAAKQWASLGEDEGALLRGVPLAEAEIWLAERGAELAPAERAFVEASVAQQARHVAEEQARAEREWAQQVRTLALERRSHRLARVVAGVAVVGAIVAGGLAATARRNAAEARSLAQASAAQAYLSSGDTGRALAVALEAVQVSNPPQQARRVLAEAAFAPGVRWEVHYPDSAITDVAVSPDGRMVALALGATFTGEIKAPGLVMHDLATGRLIRRFEGVLSSVSSVTFSPDGRQLASTANDGSLTLWDVATGQQLQRMQRRKYASAAAFIGGGEGIASLTQGGAITIWEVATGRWLQEWGTKVDFNSLDVLPDGRRLISGGRPASGGGADKVVWIWQDGKRVGRLEGRKPLAILPDGDTVAVTSPDDDAKVLVYRLATGALLQTINAEAQVSRLATSADPTTLASADVGGLIRLWDLHSGTETQRLTGHLSFITALAFGGDGLSLLSGSNDGSIRLWDLRNGEETRRHQVGRAGVGLRLVQNDAVVALATETELGLVPLAGSSPPHRIAYPEEWPKASPFTVDFSADGRLAAAGFPAAGAGVSVTRNVRLLDLATGHELPDSPLEGDGGAVGELRFTRDGARLAGVGGDGLSVWDVADGTRVLAVNLNNAMGRVVNPLTVDLSPDGQLAIVGFLEGRAATFDLATGQRGAVLAGHSAPVNVVRSSPDGRLALTGSDDRTAVLWDLISGRALRRLEGHSGAVRHMAFSPDGRRALTAGGDGTVRVWDLATGEPLQSQPVAVDDLAFLPDGDSYITVSPDGFLRTWRIDDDAASIARWAFGNRYVPELSCGERRRFLVAVGCGADERYPTRTPYPPEARPTPSPAISMSSLSAVATVNRTIAAPTAVAQPGQSAQAGRNRGNLVAGGAQSWTFEARGGTVLDVAVHAEHPADAVDDVAAQRAQGLLDTRLIIRDARGTLLAEADDTVTDSDTDAMVRNLVVPADGPLTLDVRSAGDATAGPFGLDVAATPLGTDARRLLEPNPNRLQAIVGPDGETLLTLEDKPGEDDLRHVYVRRLSDMSVRATFGITRGLRPRQLYFSSDGRRLVGNVDGNSGRVLILAAATGQVERVIQAHDGLSFNVSIVPGGRQLLSCGEDKLIRLWDMDTGAEIRRFAGHADTVTRANASPDGRLVVSSGKDHTLRVWDMASGRELRRIERPNENLISAELSPDGQIAATLAGLGRSATMLFWSPTTATVVRQVLNPYADDGIANPWPFSPDGRWLLTGVGYGLQLWDVASGREVSRLVEGIPWLRAWFTPDGQAVVALGVDGSVWWWDLAGLR